MRNGPGMKDLALLERAWGKSALQSGALPQGVTQRYCYALFSFTLSDFRLLKKNQRTTPSTQALNADT